MVQLSPKKRGVRRRPTRVYSGDTLTGRILLTAKQRTKRLKKRKEGNENYKRNLKLTASMGISGSNLWPSSGDAMGADIDDDRWDSCSVGGDNREYSTFADVESENDEDDEDDEDDEEDEEDEADEEQLVSRFRDPAKKQAWQKVLRVKKKRRARTGEHQVGQRRTREREHWKELVKVVTGPKALEPNPHNCECAKTKFKIPALTLMGIQLFFYR